MANYLPKGRERMRKLGRLGGVSSGETRRQNALNLKIANLFSIWDTCQKRGCTDEQIAAALEPLDARGGSHDDDWRCPNCHHFTSNQRCLCRKCGYSAPPDGRLLTRKALREMAEEHRTTAILRKHELSDAGLSPRGRRPSESAEPVDDLYAWGDPYDTATLLQVAKSRPETSSRER